MPAMTKQDMNAPTHRLDSDPSQKTQNQENHQYDWKHVQHLSYCSFSLPADAPGYQHQRADSLSGLKLGLLYVAIWFEGYLT